MIELTDIERQQSLVLKLELFVRRAVEALEAAPWDVTRKQHLKDQRELLRHNKRVLNQMMTDYSATNQRRMF